MKEKSLGKRGKIGGKAEEKLKKKKQMQTSGIDCRWQWVAMGVGWLRWLGRSSYRLRNSERNRSAAVEKGYIASASASVL